MTCLGPEVTGLGAYVLGALDPGERRRAGRARVDVLLDAAPFPGIERPEDVGTQAGDLRT